jgi:hypothetical protein
MVTACPLVARMVGLSHEYEYPIPRRPWSFPVFHPFNEEGISIIESIINVDNVLSREA